jgi:hypothetical protein
MSSVINKRLQTIEKQVGTDEQATQSTIDAELIVICRMRIEGVSVWTGAGGHVLYPLDFIDTRKAFQLMMGAQAERIRSHISRTLKFCAEQDPYMLDANYPLLEYFLRLVFCVVSEDRCFRPFKIPAEICDLLLSIKPEEYLHFTPADMCYECGYPYPGCRYGASHDQLAFLTTRYSGDEIKAMAAPYRGKECLLCGGEIKRHDDSSDYWQQSPANRLRQSKRQEWMAEVEEVELPNEFIGGSFIPHGHEWKEGEEALKGDFTQRRARKSFVRVEHQPSVASILRYTRG